MPWGWQVGNLGGTMTATVTTTSPCNTVYTSFATPTTTWWSGGGTDTQTTPIYTREIYAQHLMGQYQRQEQAQLMLNAYNAGLGCPASSDAGRIAAPAVLPDFEERRRRAEERAQTLLLSMLNRRERAEFKKDKAIVVRGSAGGLYRVTWGRIANIEVLDRSRQRSHRLCIHPNDPALPVPDVMLAQLLHLKASENDVLRVANRHP